MMAKHRDSVDMYRLCLVSIFVGITLFQCAFTALLQKPQNSEAVANSRVVIVCQTSEPFSVNWQHTPVGDQIPKNVFLASRVVPPYDRRIQVDVNRETGEYHLIIHSVQTIDAGKYACIDKAGQGERQVAELTVLESTPQCQESFDRNGILIDNDCGLEPEMIDFNCTLRYAGNIEPQLIWRLTGGNPIVPMNTVIASSQGQSVVSVVIKPTLPMDGRSFTCGTSWSNISWTSSTIKLLYVYNDSATHRISETTHLNCSANSSGQCSYEWRHRDTIVTVGQSLEIDGDHHGLYVCTAQCAIRENQCVVTAAVVEFNRVGSTDSENGNFTIVVVLITVIAAIAIVFSIIATFFGKRHAAIKRGLLESSSRILGAKSPSCAIQGIAIIGKSLFTICHGETSVNVYSLNEPFKLEREISSQDLRDPRDIAADSKFLYITDAELNCVWKMTTQKKTKFTKFIEGIKSPYTISINCRGEIIMAQHPNKLVICNSDGEMVKCICLKGVCNVYHAVQALPGYIATSVAFEPNSENDETAAGVILVSTTTSETVVERPSEQNFLILCKPYHITTNEWGSIFVADAGKNKIVILDKDLRLIQEVSFDSSRFLPTRLHYKSGQLIVGQNCGTIQFLGASYLERIKMSPSSIIRAEACKDRLTVMTDGSPLLPLKRQHEETV